ncbi:hypothetical protein LTR36_010105 [Oleoguttula mirabilis]|uniref:DUF6604 domain-containing protein n=1 Tax=Oleoguttula mirabilis TaxID=1507867 RepID=A0AAV9JSL4_9PEZI|nr:hypothetical protein LTR36_010105 [Oleoguttula mirabilis]
MDTNAVTDLYQRYKIGTKHVVLWLADTARKTSDLASVLPSMQGATTETTDPARKTTKGNKRKKEKKNEPDAKRLPASILTLSTQDLARLADAIASTASADKPAPAGIETTISVLEDVISGRSECTVWYRTQAEDDSIVVAESDKRHRHFVDVLRAVLEILKKTLRASRPKTAKSKKATLGAELQVADKALSNAFASLHLHEPAYLQPAEAVPAGRKIRSTTAKTMKCALEQTDEDVIFALCLPAAGEVTDKGFMLIHIAFAKLQAEFPELATFDDVSKKLRIRLTSTDGVLDSFMCDASKGSSAAGSVAGDLLCIPAVSCLSVMRVCIIEILSKDINVERMQNAVAHVLTGHRLGRVIVLHLSELVEFLLDKNVEAFLGYDVFVQDLLAFLMTPSLALHFVVEFQIYMDISDVIEKTGGRPYWTANHYAEYTKEVYARFTDAVTELNMVSASGGPLKPSQLQESVLRTINEAIGKPVIRRVDAIIQDAEDDEDDHSYVSLVLIFFPAMTGVLMSSLARLRYLDGVDICSKDSVVVAAAHLYKACRNSDALENAWEDMEFVIAHHGAQLGLREATATATPALAAAKRYGLAMGVELREYTKRARKLAREQVMGGLYGISRVALPKQSKAAPRKRCAFVGISEPYLRLLTENTAKRESLGATQWEAVNSTLHQLAHQLLSDESQDVDRDLRAQWQMCQSLTPVQLLDVFKSALIASEPTVHFSYHLLYGQCSILLEGVKKGVLGTLRRRHVWPGFVVPDEGTQLHQIVDDVLWKAAEEEMLQQSADPESMLQYSSNYFAKIIDSGRGGTWCHNAAQFSSGTLASWMKPQDEDGEDPMHLREKPEHLSNAKVTICGTEIQLTKPTKDPRWEEWRLRMAEVDMVVEAQGGSTLSHKERKQMVKRVMEQCGVKRWYKDKGDRCACKEASACACAVQS